MMVPRAYRYSSSPPRDMHLNEKSGAKRSQRKDNAPAPTNVKAAVRPTTAARTSTEPMKVPSKPMAVPQPERTHSSTTQSLPSRTRRVPNKAGSRSPVAHDPDALPPAVAALLAVTAIPPPKPHQLRRKSRDQRRVSIDELVNEWKSDETFHGSYSSSPALSILLEDASDGEEEAEPASVETVESDGFLHTRSTSSESVPSLDADQQSILSLGSPSTPESLRSRKSSSNLRRDRMRSLTETVDSTLDHPLNPPPPVDPDDALTIVPPLSGRSSTPKPRTTFTSNLTSSLRALQNATLNSISTFTLTTNTTPFLAPRPSNQRFADDLLWSHPFIFPRLSSEMRPPTIEGTPTEAQRRYLNPQPLNFEEQEAPFQLALHAPYLAERIDDVPTIPMQTYTRNGQKRPRASSPRRSASPDPNTEAGRALLASANSAAGGVRQREVRENSDFLRVVVLEMNMRREGKLESGKARIWLPPRQVVSVCAPSAEFNGARVPSRWVGVSAYD